MSAVFSSRIFLGFFLLSLVFSTPNLISQETQEKTEPQTKFDGQADLDQAFDLMLNATETRDLDKIVELCESAIKKGIDETNTVQAKELIASTLLKYAEQFESRILPPNQDRRWRVYRREVIARLKKAIEFKPDLVSAHLLIAKLNVLDGGNREEAAASISKAIDLATENPKLLSQALLVRAQLAPNDEQRMNDLSQAVKIDPSNDVALQARGALHLKMENSERALEDFEKLAELRSDSPETALLVVQILLDLDRKEDAEKKLDEFIAKSPESAMLFAVRAKMNLDKKENEKALADAEKALILDKDEVEALVVRAIVLADKKEHDNALRDINRALELQPGGVRAMWIRGLILASKRDYVGALKDVKQIAQSFPDEPAYQIQLAALYNANDEPTKAIAIYDQLLEKNPGDWEILRGRGDARLSIGEHEKAIADYEKALEQMPEDEADDGLYNNFAWVLSTSTFDNLRNGKRAIELATKACDLTEYKAAHILSTLASSYAETGDFENAKKWAAKAVEVSEGDDDQKSNLKRELESYQQGRAWRELQEPGKKDSGFPAPLPGEKSDNASGEKSDDKKSDDKSIPEKSADDKSEKKDG